MALYWTSNNAAPTTAGLATQTTGTAIRTMLQIATPSTSGLSVVAFGVEFASVLTASAQVELIDTVSVAATGLTAHVSAGVQPYDAAARSGTSLVTLGTGATGYTASTTCTEGSITATRLGKNWVMPIGSSEREWEWSQGREFDVPPSHFLRVRVTTSVSIGATVWCLWAE